MTTVARGQRTFSEQLQEERSRYRISLETGIARDGNCPSKKE